MALDTQEKRMAASGVGRPWARAKLPGSNDQEWRIASGLAYGGNSIATPPDPYSPDDQGMQRQAAGEANFPRQAPGEAAFSRAAPAEAVFPRSKT